MEQASLMTKEIPSFVAPFVPRLTLSSCHRPEQTVRLTDADSKRFIRADYDLDHSSRQTLGRGSGGTVKLASRRGDGMLVAVKTIKKHHALGLWNGAGRWRRGSMGQAPRIDEVDVLTSLKDSCPGIVGLLDVYETQNEIQMVLEYCEGGDLFECIQRRRMTKIGCGGSFSESETATLAKTMLKVLDELHSKSIVHRDIKPENLLLVDRDEGGDSPLGSVKLTDFGLARLLPADDDADDDESLTDASMASGDLPVPARRRSRAYSYVGSDYYSAPEVHLGAGYDTPVDIYSLGITLFVMLCGVPPSSTSLFKSEDADFTDEDSICMTFMSDDSTQSSQCSSSGLFPTNVNVSPLCKDFISKMIHPDPDKRITASEAMKHEWITKHYVHKHAQVMTPATSKLFSSSSGDVENLNVKPIIETFAIGLALIETARAPKRHRHRGPHVDRVRFKKRSRGGGWDECTEEETCVGVEHHLHPTPARCVSCRITRRFNAGVRTFGPFLPGHYEGQA